MNALAKNSFFNYPSLMDALLQKEGPDFFTPTASGTVPAVNVIESADEFRIELAAPGLQKEHFALKLDNNLLTVSATKEDSSDTKAERYTRREFSYSSFQRTFTLPTSVNTERIAASYTDGILSVSLPKRDEAKVKPVRLIDIQ